MKVCFLGTPNFAKIVLEKLYNSHHKVVAVVCSKSKPSGRGKKLFVPPTKDFAEKHNIDCYQFSKIRVDGVETLKKIKADIFVTASFGQILSQEILDIAPYGVVNVHGSLLPKYRGASPVQTAILNGEKITGITIMKTFAGIDNGDIISQKEVEISTDDNTKSLMEKLAVVGGDLLCQTLDEIENNTAVYTPQNESNATFTKMLKKENSNIDFSLPAEKINNFVRAYNPDPSCHFTYKNERFKVIKTKVFTNKELLPLNKNFSNGEVVISSSKKGLIVACGQGFLEIEILQAPSSKQMSAKSYLNGKKIPIGDILE